MTGAARGIGAAIARRPASDGMAVAVPCDVSDEDQVAAAVARVADELGAPTVLVNNAGILRDDLIFKISAGDWDAVLNVRLRGAFLMSRARQAHMVKARLGRIVNMSSTSASGNRGQVNHSAAKAGMQGLTKTRAIELGRFGVTVNAIAPGFIVTDMTGRDRRWDRCGFRTVPAGRRRTDPRRAGRTTRGHRRRSILPVPGRSRVRLRLGHLRRRRAERLTGTRMRAFTGTLRLIDVVGQHLGYSRWHRITQQGSTSSPTPPAITRAAAGPYGGTIAHGFPTLSLLPMLASEVYRIDGVSMGVSYGVDKVRFPDHVPVGSRPRAGVQLDTATETPHRAHASKQPSPSTPACVARWLTLVIP